MEKLRTSETLDENGQAQNSCGNTLEGASGLCGFSDKCSDLASDSEIIVGKTSGDFDGNLNGLEIGNVDVLGQIFDVGKEIKFCEGSGAKEGQSNGGLVEYEEGRKEGNESQLKGGDSAGKIEVSGNISLFVEVFGPLDGIIRNNESSHGEDSVGGEIFGGGSMTEGDGALLANYPRNADCLSRDQLTAKSGFDSSNGAVEVNLLNASEKKEEGLAELRGGENDVMGKRRSEVMEEKLSSSEMKLQSSGRERIENSEDCNAHTLASSFAENNIFSEENGNGGIEGKLDKGVDSRERKKSRYLSPPYIYLGKGRKNLPNSEERETDDRTGVSQEGLGKDAEPRRSLRSSSAVKSSSKKSQRKGSRKATSGHNTFGKLKGINASPSELLSELLFAALDCTYPDRNKDFNSVEEFFRGFRKFVFHDESDHEINNKIADGTVTDNKSRTIPGDEIQTEKKIGTEEGNAEHSEDVKKDVDCHCSVGEDPKTVAKPRKRKKKGQAFSWNPDSAPALLDMSKNISSSGSIVLDFQEMCVVTPEGKPLVKKRKKKAGPSSELLQTNTTAGLPDVNGNCTSKSTLVDGSQVKSPAAPKAKPEPKKRKRKDGVISMHSTDKSTSSFTWTTTLDSFLKNVPVVAAPSLDGTTPKLNSTQGIADSAPMCLNTEPQGIRIDFSGENSEKKFLNTEGKADSAQMCLNTGPLGIRIDFSGENSEKNSLNTEGKADSAQMCLNTGPPGIRIDFSGENSEKNSFNTQGKADSAQMCLNTGPSGTQIDFSRENSEKSTLNTDQMNLLSFRNKREPKKRKRKEKASLDSTKIASAIPDLNGNAAQFSSSGKKDLGETTSNLAEDKIPHKRRKTKADAMMPDIDVNKLQANGEASGTALILKFAPEFPVPSKEDLATFCVFGPLKELGTRLVDDPSIGEIIFQNRSDARAAFCSLEKSSPFGKALVNYRLVHLSASSEDSEKESNLHAPRAIRPMEGLTIPTSFPCLKPNQNESPDKIPTSFPGPIPIQNETPIKIPATFPGPKPNQNENPDLFHIRQNLEMMTSMLEKAGDNLPPAMRAKLETEIKGLMKKVSTMVGGSTSS